MTSEEIQGVVSNAIARDRAITAKHARQLRELFGDTRALELAIKRLEAPEDLFRNRPGASNCDVLGETVKTYEETP